MEEKKDVKDLVEELHNLGVAVAVFTGEDFINLSELEGDADEAEEWILDNRRRLEEAMWGGAEDLYRYCKAVE